MRNERDRISEYFEAKGVSRGEFEALKRLETMNSSATEP
jgi:hypothetical protein